MKTALLLIDLQKDYFPGGRMVLEGCDAAVERAQEVLTFFRNRNWPLVHIHHLSLHPEATFFLPGTAGIEFHDRVRPLPGEKMIEKYFPNSFRDTPLLEYLKNWKITEVVIVGMMTHMCVEATTRAAFDLGFNCTVVQDACATRALSFNQKTVPADHVQAAFLAALGAVYARIVDTQALLTGLQ